MAASGGTAPDASAKPDLNDVKYDAFLANDRTLADPYVVEGRARRDRAAADHQRLVDERLSHRPRPSRRQADRRRRPSESSRYPGTAFRSRWPSGSISSHHAARPTVRPVLAVLEGESRRTGIVLAAGTARDRPRIDDQPWSRPRLHAGHGTPSAQRASPEPRKADRVRRVDLTGNMATYVWSLNNVVWTKETPPLQVAKGERVGIVIDQQDNDATSDASARSCIPGRSDRPSATVGRNARYGAGAARQQGHRRVRRQQSGPMGVPLPSAVSHGSGHVSNHSLRLDRDPI